MRKFISLAIFLLGAAIPAFAQDQARDLTGQSANVFGDGSGLTLPSGASAADIVADFLASEGLGEATLASLVQTAEIPGLRGVTHFRFAQDVDGLAVYGTYVRAAINADGQLIHLIENLADTAGGVRPAFVGPRAALNAALNRVHPGISVDLSETGRAGNAVSFGGDSFFWSDPTATRVAIVMNNGALHEGFLVETWTDDDNQLNHTLIGGQGNVLGVQSRTNNDSYKIFPIDPGTDEGVQTVVNDPAGLESPSGWLFEGNHESIDIAGNNVHAYLDTDANNSADPGGAMISDGNFLASANLLQEPETPANQDVAVQNLFYLNNVLHDMLYDHGFVESAGNFQEDNFGGGGGNDSVNAEAQDGSGTNNANFATPSDGSSPRMQMFVWTQSSPKRDGDLDSDIVYHEYGHGLTWRMIGNMGGSMSGAVGEGMSDVLAILINDDDVLAEYSYNDPGGIRSAPYTNYPRTYGDFSGNSVHFNGEIYAAIGWHLGELFDLAGISRDTLFDYIVGGMIPTLPGPSFEDMRDGILVVANGTGHECLIWEAFADYGVGFGASSTINGGGPFGGGKVKVTESFAMPVLCSDSQPPNASFTFTCNALNCDFDGSGSNDPDGGDIVSYDWNFGDPSDSNPGSGVTPSHTYAAAGTYTVTLTVIDDETDADTTSQDVTVSNDLPVASFTVNCTNLVCEFDGSGSDDPDGGAIDTYQWDFGDPIDSNPGSGVTPSHTYATADTYTVTLTVTDEENDSGSTTVTFDVSEAPDHPVSTHIGDLDDGGAINSGGTWTAQVIVTVHSDGEPVSGATVTGTWSQGAPPEASCNAVTDVNGTCAIALSGIAKRDKSVTFTVGDVVLVGETYDSGDNHDPDADSNGTAITVTR